MEKSCKRSSNWDLYLQDIAERRELSKTARNCFLKLYSEQGIEGIKNVGSIDKYVRIAEAQIPENTYKTHQSAFYRILEEEFKVKSEYENEKYEFYLNQLRKGFIEFEKNIIEEFNVKHYSLEQNFSEIILNVDYSSQLKNFLKNSSKFAFYLSTSNDDIEANLQKMLVFRLCKNVVDEYDIPQVIDIQFTRAWQSLSQENVCQELSKIIGLRQSNSYSDLLLGLEDLLQTKSLIISLREVRNMGRHFDDFWNSLWCPLAKKYSEIDISSTETFIKLFMTGTEDFTHISKSVDSYSLVKLQNLESISNGMIFEWKETPECKKFIRRCAKQKHNLNFNYITNLVNSEDNSLFGKNVYHCMQILCEEFGFSDDYSQFKNFWSLSGEVVLSEEDKS